MRVVCWFSCGAASAVATKLALERYPTEEFVISYCDTGSEHEDNKRFMIDCEKWFGQEIIVLKNPKYEDTWSVFRKEKYLVGVRGARCTGELKKKPRFQFQKRDDLQVFGFDKDETGRAKRFTEQNPGVDVLFPLIDAGISKRECFDMIRNQGIEIPLMYRLGYKNNNCIGCVKGGTGYWNKIRRDFPDVFERMSNMEQELNVAICKTTVNGKRQRTFLKDLDPTLGRYEAEPSIGCGVICDITGIDGSSNEQ